MGAELRVTHDVFISHASEDAAVANDLCLTLEQNGPHCWLAPRDIVAGSPYADAILEAIQQCKVFVLLLSEASAASPHVLREVERAVSGSIPIVPVRIADVRLSKALEYLLSTTQWFDAFVPPMSQRLSEVANIIVATIARSAVAKSPVDAGPEHGAPKNATAVAGTADIGGRQVPSAAELLEFGRNVKSTIRDPNDVQSYIVPAKVGDILMIRLHDSSSSPGSPIRWEPHVQLCDARRSVIAESMSMVRLRLGPLTVNAPGPLLLFVRNNVKKSTLDGRGDFNLVVQRVNDPGSARALSIGEAVQSALANRGDVHTYLVEAADAGLFRLTMTRGSGESGRHMYPWLELFDPFGQLVEAVQAHSPVGEIKPARIEWTVRSPGTFTVLAGCYLDGIGTYTIGLDRIDTDADDVEQRRWLDEVVDRYSLPAITELASWIYVTTTDARLIIGNRPTKPNASSGRQRVCEWGERLSIVALENESLLCEAFEGETGTIDASACEATDPKVYFAGTILGRHVVGALYGRQHGRHGRVIELSMRGGTVRVPVSRVSKIGARVGNLAVVDVDGDEYFLDSKEWAGSTSGWPATFIYGRWPMIKSGHGVELRFREEELEKLGGTVVISRCQILPKQLESV